MLSLAEVFQKKGLGFSFGETHTQNHNTSSFQEGSKWNLELFVSNYFLLYNI